MEIYDYIGLPDKYMKNQFLDKNKFLNPFLSDEQNKLLLTAIDNIILKYSVIFDTNNKTSVNSINRSDKFDIVEIDINNYQYFYFVPNSVFRIFSNPTLLILKYKNKYKICIDVLLDSHNHSENETNIYFTGWIDINNPLGRMNDLLSKLKYSNYNIDIYSYYRDIVLDYKAVYVTGNKIEILIKYVVRHLKWGYKNKVQLMIKNKLISYVYQQKKGYKKGCPYVRGYVFLYDIDEVWNVLMSEDWICSVLEKYHYINGYDLLNKYEEYIEKWGYDYIIGVDHSSFAFSDVLYKSSNWYNIDFICKSINN